MVSFSKWPEILKCKRLTTETVINFLHQLFALFSVADCIVSGNGTQFTFKEFKDFCQTFAVKHITIASYHPSSNGQAEHFIDTFKRALKKAKGTPTDTAIQQFLQVYRVTQNKNALSDMMPAEVVFARKIRSVFDKLIPKKAKIEIFKESNK